MKWEGNRESDNVEDRRSDGGGGFGGGGGLLGGRSIGIGTIVVALVGGWMFGINPLTLLSMLSGGSAPTATRTACGQGQAAMGPFYCPGDQKVYIDLGFYETLKTQLGAPGDFAQAYVIAHEVGHHVQNLLGISGKMDQMRGRVSKVEYNALSVKLELQADCFAGVWAHHAQSARQILEQGDVEEAMNAAARIGDDALQRSGGGAVVPDSFTHGTSAQRQRWFDTGLKNGNVKTCDTFGARNL